MTSDVSNDVRAFFRGLHYNQRVTMIEDGLDLLLKYPLISCEMRNGNKHYTGRIMCGNCDIDLHIIEEKTHTGVKFKVKTNSAANFENITSNSKTITECLDALLADKIGAPPTNHVNVYRKVLQEYSEFTGFHLTVKNCHIATDLSRITVSTMDDAGREHNLEISVDLDKSKDIFKPLNVILPEQVAKEFCTNFSNLSEIYSKFLATLEDLQPFFDLMDDLDSSCCVVDPEQPTRRDCYRRIWLDRNLSVMVTVDPFNITATPDLKFLGPERITELYVQKLGTKLENWDGNANVVQGLLNILELEEFPVKLTKEREMLMDVGECSICFSLRLNEKLPEVICGNKSCENFYHVECLYEWLTSVNSKRIFNQLQGQCPNCEKTISCPLPDVEVT